MDADIRFGQMTLYYYPDGTPIESDELLPVTLKWALLFEMTKDRIVGQHKTPYGEKLSTVWLGLDHGWGGGPPLIFETMLFAPTKEVERVKRCFPHDQLQLRYSTKSEAEDMHEALRLQCLIPPRWRHFLLGTVGGLSHWKNYDEEEE